MGEKKPTWGGKKVGLSQSWVSAGRQIAHRALTCRSHEANHLLSRNHLRRPKTDMAVRDSLSKLKKKLKHRLVASSKRKRDSLSKLKKKLKHLVTSSKRKPDGTGADVGGERVDPTGSLSRPVSESRITVGGGLDQGESVENAGGPQICSTDRLSHPDQPESVPAHGSENESDQGGGDGDVDGREVGQGHSHPHSEVEVAVAVESGSGLGGNDADGEKAERVHPSPSTPSIPPSAKSEST